MEVSVEVNNITKLYKNKRGIKDISFAIKDGEIFGLLGPNGAGKTTAMKVITGLVRAQKGNVKVYGKDVSEQTDESLSCVGSLIEAPALISYMTARQNMNMASRFYSAENCDTDGLLSIVGLLPYANEKTSKFSLGMKQRLGIALSLVGNPKVLILDEPANGLDIEGMVEIRNIILELAKKRHSTFIISSHLAVEIEKTCTKVGIMVGGSIVAIQSMDYVLENHPSLEDYFLYVVHESRKGVQQ